MQVCCNDNFAGAYSPLVSISTGAPASVTFDRVTKVYDSVTALSNFTLDVAAGEFMVFVGPSGCGKTTALRMVAGLEKITAGEISIGDDTVNELDPRRRDVAMVFQNYALYPHMTVFENVAFGLRARRAPKGEIRRRVERATRALGLAELLERKPSQLSGGQRQRVAMGRAIVREPRVFLMDEPLSNLDARLRVQMRAEVARVQRELGVTTIYVTHDQVEAMTMGDRVAVMRGGLLQQTGDPQVVFDRPANLFVASFLGSPPMNLVQAQLSERDGGLAAQVGEQEVAVPAEMVVERPGLRAYAGRTVGLGIRPEHLREANGDSRTRLRGTVRATEALGSEFLVHLEVAAEPVLTEEVREVAGDVDAAALQRLESEAMERRTVLIARLESHHRPPVDEAIEVGVDTRRLHFFDLDSGIAIYDT
ncbi:MAG: sn-glycerol-3-phosphate ABC transporter ATP-binding protein UgpC [Actinobacteria bacterium]|nr:sn-glycerol-3-phosphate ABC transporter ATP-binding protein UgpC [Actinomycetota bacterium]